MAQQGEHAVPDQVGRRLVAGEQEQSTRVDELLLAERSLRGLYARQPADEVVAWCAPAFADDVPEIGVERRATRARPAEPLSAVGRHAYEATCGREVRGPGPELRAVLGRHAEQFGDDDGGQGKSEVGDEVQATCFGGAVEELVDDRLNAGA